MLRTRRLFLLPPLKVGEAGIIQKNPKFSSLPTCAGGAGAGGAGEYDFTAWVAQRDLMCPLEMRAEEGIWRAVRLPRNHRSSRSLSERESMLFGGLVHREIERVAEQKESLNLRRGKWCRQKITDASVAYRAKRRAL